MELRRCSPLLLVFAVLLVSTQALDGTTKDLPKDSKEASDSTKKHVAKDSTKEADGTLSTSTRTPVNAGATIIPVRDASGIKVWMTITISNGKSSEHKTIVSVSTAGGSGKSRRLAAVPGSITVDSPLKFNYPSGTSIVAYPQEPCPRPERFCIHAGARYMDTLDCDGDGIPDPNCVSTHSSGFVGSASNCASNWPVGLCKDAIGTLPMAKNCNDQLGDVCGEHGSPTGRLSHCSCSCDAGWHGVHCETAGNCTTGANGSPCQNGGRPTGKTGSCGCKCVDGYFGANCQTPADAKGPIDASLKLRVADPQGFVQGLQANSGGATNMERTIANEIDQNADKVTLATMGVVDDQVAISFAVADVLISHASKVKHNVQHKCDVVKPKSFISQYCKHLYIFEVCGSTTTTTTKHSSTSTTTTTTTTTTKETSTSTTTTTTRKTSTSTTTTTTLETSTSTTTTTTTISSSTTTTTTVTQQTTFSDRTYVPKHMVFGDLQLMVGNSVGFKNAINSNPSMKSALEVAIADIIPSVSPGEIRVTSLEPKADAGAIVQTHRRLQSGQNPKVWMRDAWNKVKNGTQHILQKLDLAPKNRPQVFQAAGPAPAHGPAVPAAPVPAQAPAPAVALATQIGAQPSIPKEPVDVYFEVACDDAAKTQEVNTEVTQAYDDPSRFQGAMCTRLQAAGMQKRISGCDPSEFTGMFIMKPAVAAPQWAHTGVLFLASCMLFVLVGGLFVLRRPGRSRWSTVRPQVPEYDVLINGQTTDHNSESTSSQDRDADDSGPLVLSVFTRRESRTTYLV